MWFSKKNVLLFPGANSPVTAISWRGNVVAWADANHVRLMDVTTQTGLCYVSSPQGVGIHNPFPCHLYWETDCVSTVLETAAQPVFTDPLSCL